MNNTPRQLSYLHINDLPRHLYTLEAIYLGTYLGSKEKEIIPLLLLSPDV